jgi:hypothetical protein
MVKPHIPSFITVAHLPRGSATLNILPHVWKSDAHGPAISLDNDATHLLSRYGIHSRLPHAIDDHSERA